MTEQHQNANSGSVVRGGLRRLQKDSIDKERNKSSALSRPQFMRLLADDIERAKRDDNTVLVSALRIRPLPETQEKRLGEHVLSGELIGRLHGIDPAIRVVARDRRDLFLVVPIVQRRPDGEALLWRILDAFSTPIVVGGLRHHMAPIIGGVVMDSQNDTADSLIDGADLALNESDRSNPATMFHPYQRVRKQRRLELKEEVRQAIIDQQITIAYQPVVNVADGGLQALEILARWSRPEGGPVPSLEFIPLAREAGVVHLLTEQVLASAIALIDSMRSLVSNRSEPLTLWLNVSPEDVLYPDFTDVLLEAVRCNDHIEIGLELAPSPLADDRQTYERLKLLSSNHVRIAMADFGIGNANLNVLQQLPFDSVKLDRTLIRQIAGNQGAAAIVDHLISLAHALDLETTAQGIETQDQHDLVRRLGCTLGQGFHFAAPTTEPDLLASVLAHSPGMTTADLEVGADVPMGVDSHLEETNQGPTSNFENVSRDHSDDWSVAK